MDMYTASCSQPASISNLGSSCSVLQTGASWAEADWFPACVLQSVPVFVNIECVAAGKLIELVYRLTQETLRTV